MRDNPNAAKRWEFYANVSLTLFKASAAIFKIARLADAFDVLTSILPRNG